MRIPFILRQHRQFHGSAMNQPEQLFESGSDTHAFCSALTKRSGAPGRVSERRWEVFPFLCQGCIIAINILFIANILIQEASFGLHEILTAQLDANAAWGAA